MSEDQVTIKGSCFSERPYMEVIQEVRHLLAPGGSLKILDDFGHQPVPIDNHERDDSDKINIVKDFLYANGFRVVSYHQAERESFWEGKKFEHHQRVCSLVILCHNQKAYIQQSVNAALAQTYTPTEIIVVNEGSTDGSAELIDEMGTRYPQLRIIHHTEAQGVASSLNEAFRLSKGQYLTWTGADNIVHPHMLSVLSSVLDTYSFLGGVYSDYAVIDEEGLYCYNTTLPEYSFDQLLERYIVGVSFLMRRDLFEKVGGCDESLRLSEDYDLWLHIATQAELRHVPEILYTYRFHDKHLTIDLKSRRKHNLQIARSVSEDIRAKYRGRAHV